MRDYRFESEARCDPGCQWRARRQVSDEELSAFAEFTEAQIRGERPDLETHLAKYPQFEPSLRPVLETAVWFYEEVKRFRREHPDASVWDFLGSGPDRGDRLSLSGLRDYHLSKQTKLFDNR